MKIFSHLYCLIRINFILLRYDLWGLLLTTPRFSAVRFLIYLNPWRFGKNKRTPRGDRILSTLQRLGPIYIKAGQILSTRRDLLPDDIAEALAKLQDQVPPFSGEHAKKIIEAALESPLQEIFQHFDLTALASASIAQVHRATLLEGDTVVVKVLRPNIEKTIAQDIRLFYALAAFLEKWWVHTKRFKPLKIVEEIEFTLYNELDLLREAANAAQLRRNFENSDQLYVPAIYWPYCRTNILVIEYVSDIPINQIMLLKESPIYLKNLAEMGVHIFFTQILRDGFFHADMHPGNIFISKKNPEHPRYVVVDFGIMGSLSKEDQRYLAENMLAFFERDYRRVAELHVACGWLPPHTRIDQFEAAIRSVCEPIFGRPLKDISFGQLLLRLFQTAQAFQINIQPQLLLLQKTLLNVEGVGRQLYPDLDIWKIATPLLRRWVTQQVGFRGFLARVKESLPYWSERLPEMPRLLYDVLSEIKARQQIKKVEIPFQKYPLYSSSGYFFFGISATLVAALLAMNHWRLFLPYGQRMGIAIAAGILLITGFMTRRGKP